MSGTARGTRAKALRLSSARITAATRARCSHTGSTSASGKMMATQLSAPSLSA
ncbi:hypothetical protein ACFQ2B_11660 [Streptomyces stramineus]